MEMLLEIRQVQDADRRAALGRLMASGLALSDAQHAQLDTYARKLGVRYEHFWAGYDETGRLGPAALMVARPGRTGMMFASPVRKRRDLEPTARVIAAAAESADPQQVHLLQALVDTDAHLEGAAFKGAGFGKLATLSYLQRSVPRRPDWPAMPDGVTVLPYADEHRARFAAVLEQSYEDTLDCPGLRGVRAIEDVMDGHRSTGQFDPGLWSLLVEGDRPLGVCLVNRLDEMEGAELVYLGLAPAGRGKGYGALLVKRGLALCAEAGARAMTLAVDQANEPALGLYRRLGFYRVARKLALTKTVSGPASSS